MAGIGADIAEVMTELGVSATILRTPTNIVEKITYDINEQATNAFVREFHLNASFAYNTAIVPGDVLQIGSEYYLAINKTPDMFEGEVVEYASVIFKCNLPSSTLILDPTTTKDAVSFAITNGWTVRKSSVYGLIYKEARGVILHPEATTGKDTTFTLRCIVPATYAVEKLDRLYLSATEYFRVQDVERYEYPGVLVLSLVEDDRAGYTP